MTEPEDVDGIAKDKNTPKCREVQDPWVRRMIALGIPVTRANYLSLTAPEADPDDLDPELELALPPELRIKDDDEDNEKP